MKKRSNISTFMFHVSCFIICVSSFALHASSIQAANMESNQYRIQHGIISTGGDDLSSTDYKLSTTLGQTVASQFESSGYIIKAGFQYMHSIIPFGFKVSDTQIDLGSVNPNNPKKASITLTVNFGSAGQYQVVVHEEGPLKTFDKKSNIADTNCDGGKNTCTETKASFWTQSKAYGFGYNIQGDDISADFKNDQYFRSFADTTLDEPSSIIMHSTNVGKNRQAIVTFKVNISPLQTTGSYDTVINLIALPSF